jgi:hypothetical protein
MYPMSSSHGLACLAGAVLLAVVASTPAEARIQCQGNYQVTKHGLISTPYCEDNQIALVARSYGWRVTPAEIRANPLTKVRICQILGGDIRLKGSCAGYAPEQYR